MSATIYGEKAGTYHTFPQWNDPLRGAEYALGLFLGSTGWRFGKGKYQNLFASNRGNVVVHADEFYAYRIFHDRFQSRATSRHHVGSHLLEQGPSVAVVMSAGRVWPVVSCAAAVDWFVPG